MNEEEGEEDTLLTTEDSQQSLNLSKIPEIKAEDIEENKVK